MKEKTRRRDEKMKGAGKKERRKEETPKMTVETFFPSVSSLLCSANNTKCVLSRKLEINTGRDIKKVYILSASLVSSSSYSQLQLHQTPKNCLFNE